MTAPGARMAAEIAEQPAALERLLTTGRGPVDAVARTIADRAPRMVMLAARGTSDHAALYAKYLVEIGLGLPAGLASPSSLTAYGARPDLRDVLWITVSQSGGSPDLVESARVARACGALTVAVVNAIESPLAEACELRIDVLAGVERAIAATKSYTSELLALWLLVESWRGSGGDGGVGGALRDAAARLPELAAELVASGRPRAIAPRYRFAERLVLTARGYGYASAREAALKLMETSYVSAHAFSGADLLHGPMAMIDEERPVIVIASPGAGGAALGPVLERLRERGADVLVVGPRGVAPWAAAAIEIPMTDEPLAPILQIIPMQQLALEMALARGHDPDAPRGLAKVTETR